MSKCRRCIYRYRAASRWACNYAECTGRLRSPICPPGDECTVFVEGHRLQPPTMKDIEAIRCRATRKQASGARGKKTAAGAANTDDGKEKYADTPSV